MTEVSSLFGSDPQTGARGFPIRSSCSDLASRCFPVNIQQFCDKVTALIGRFDLDPNRVVGASTPAHPLSACCEAECGVALCLPACSCSCADLILETYERRPDKAHVPHFLRLLDMFNKASLCPILGFKFHQYQLLEAAAPEAYPTALYDVAAALIQAGRIKLAELYPHVSHPVAALCWQLRRTSCSCLPRCPIGLSVTPRAALCCPLHAAVPVGRRDGSRPRRVH